MAASRTSSKWPKLNGKKKVYNSITKMTESEWEWFTQSASDCCNKLRRNPAEVRVTSGQKSCTKIIYSVLKTSVGLFSISSKKQFISSNTKRRKRMLNFVWNTWKFWWNETDLWTLKFIFSRSRGNLFSVLFQAIIYVFRALRFKNVKMTVKYLKLLWYRFLSTKTWNCSIFYRISS